MQNKRFTHMGFLAGRGTWNIDEAGTGLAQTACPTGTAI